MPEDAQLPVVELARLVRPDGLVHAEVLVVLREDFGRGPVGTVVEDEVFEEVEEILLPADAAQHGLQRHAPLVLFRQTLPFVEEPVLAAERPHLRRQPVGEDQERVVVEKMRDRVQVVGVIVLVGVPHVHRRLLQLHEEQREAVHEAHDVRPAAVQLPVDLQLLDRQEFVVLRVPEVDHRGGLRLRLPVRLLDRYRDAVADQEILLLVRLQQRCGGQAVFQYLLSFRYLILGHPRVQPLQSSAEIPHEQDVPIRLSPERPVNSQHLRVVRELDIPAKLILKQFSGAFLNKNIFRIIVTHEEDSGLSTFFIIVDKSDLVKGNLLSNRATISSF